MWPEVGQLLTAAPVRPMGPLECRYNSADGPESQDEVPVPPESPVSSPSSAAPTGKDDRGRDTDRQDPGADAGLPAALGPGGEAPAPRELAP